MKISESWLRELSSPPGDTATLVHQLTMQGLEVEGIENAGPTTLDNVVVGLVTGLAAHPDADRLRVCQVDVGRDPIQIVCGASNVRVGGRYPTALPGARLPGGLEIRAATLRGVESAGMLCSAVELGLADAGPASKADGLLELGDLEAGAPLSQALDLDDQILDLKITPNRADCFSVLGLARDLAATAGLPFAEPVHEPVPATDSPLVPVAVEDPKASPVFAVRAVRNIRADAPSPLWLRERLRRSGIRSIHPVVDITNLVMLELGQPLHAYDLDKLVSGLVVRRALHKETLQLLTGSEVQLDPDVLVIADKSTAIGMAGIMGGITTAVSGATTNVLFEAAFFAPSVIAGRARRFGLQTDAATRFERGVDPSGQRRALERATGLLLAIAGGVPGACQVAGQEQRVRSPLLLRRERLSRVLGLVVADNEVHGILQRLGMQVEERPTGWQVTPPSFRFDISVEVDLIEEVARVYGYDRIAAEPGQQATHPGVAPAALAGADDVRAVLVQRGYQEAVTYSFVDRDLDRWIAGGRPGIALVNPLSADLAVMRQSLWTGLAQAVRHNLTRQQRRVRLFEIGVRFIAHPDGVREEVVVAGIATGNAFPEQWGEKDRPVDYYDGKGDLEAVLGIVGPANTFEWCSGEHPALQPGRSAVIRRDGVDVGWLGGMHPSLAQQFGLDECPVMFEVALSPAVMLTRSQYQQLSRFPSVRRDLAMIVPRETPAAVLVAAAQEAAGSVLREVIVFDIFAGGHVDTGQKSVALGLILQETSRTLTDAETDHVVGSIVQRLAAEFGARMR